MRTKFLYSNLSLILEALSDPVDAVSEQQLLVGVQLAQRGPRVLVVWEFSEV